jgi:hypothetical protein
MRVVSQRQSIPGSAIGRAFPTLVYGFDRCVLFPTCPLKARHVDVVKRILRAPSTCVKVPDASCDRPLSAVPSVRRPAELTRTYSRRFKTLLEWDSRTDWWFASVPGTGPVVH